MWFKPGSLAVVLAIAASSSPTHVASFAPSPAAFGVGRAAVSECNNNNGHIPSTTTALCGRAIKRGKLVSNVSPGGVKTSAKKKKKKKGSGGGPSSSSSEGGGGISSKLSDWAASDGGDAAVDVAAAPVESPAPPAVPSKKKGGKMGGKKKKASGSNKTERREQEIARRALVTSTIDDLDDIFVPVDDEGKPITQRKVEYDLTYILDKIRTLVDNNTGGLRVLSAGQELSDFRLVWAGSDDAICHLGTGLHNVPLARLEETFLTLGKGRIEIKEVIRIIGPFPNVRNTLKGAARVAKGGGSGESNNDISRLSVEYDSMVDGTGKEILAGTETNKRLVDVDVLYADEDAVVCVVPPEEGEEGGDPLGENGSKVMLFFSEDDMDLKLESMRVG